MTIPCHGVFTGNEVSLMETPIKRSDTLGDGRLKICVREHRQAAVERRKDKQQQREHDEPAGWRPQHLGPRSR